VIAAKLVILAALLGNSDSHTNAGTLPVCSNRVINEVVKRTGCTLGDARCWLRSGGFCTDYVEKKVAGGRPQANAQMVQVKPEEIRRGDVAVFASRAHYAFIEKVVVDKAGQPIALELSEFNYGDCWVDQESMVTDKYKVVNRRAGVPVATADGGFLRAKAPSK
jgi:hypothetical protein